MIRFDSLKNDIFAGITAAVVALPLALAFGVQSGLGAIAGLYGAVILGFFAALLGGTATQISGPTGPMTVVSIAAVTAASAATGSLDQALNVIIVIFFLAGFFQLVFCFLKLGKYVKYIPYPVLSGFMSGIGCIIICSQVFPALGHSASKSALEMFLTIGVPLSAINGHAVILTVLTICVIYLFPRWTKVVPAALVALISMTIVAIALHFNVPVIGEIPSGIPHLTVPHVFSLTEQQWMMGLEFGLTLAALGAIDSLLTSVVADNKTKTEHNSNRELFGQGIGNMLSSLFGGIPGAGATMRTVVNIDAGGKTRLSGVVHSVLLAIIVLGLGRYAAYIPLSVLSGILISVGLSIIDYKGLKDLFRVPRDEAVILIVVLLVTVFGNLLMAVAIGLILACFTFMKKISDLTESSSSLNMMTDIIIDEKPLGQLYASYQANISVKHINGPLFFGAIQKFKSLMQNITVDTKVLIVRMEDVSYMDQSGLYAMEETLLKLTKNNVLILLSGLQEQPRHMLERIQLIPEVVLPVHVFDTFKECERWLRQHVDELFAPFKPSE